MPGETIAIAGVTGQGSNGRAKRAEMRIQILLLDFGFRRDRFAVILLVLMSGLAGQALAQTATGSLQGFVCDPSGAAVTTATVQVTGASGTRTTANTGKDGIYQFKSLAPGQYSIKARAKGFSLYEVGGITVAAGQPQKFDIPLAILVEETHINVSDQDTVVDTSAANNASQIVLTGKDLDALSDDPVSTRRRSTGARRTLSAGQTAARFTLTDSPAARFRRSLPSAKFALTRTRSRQSTTSSATGESRSSPNRAPTSFTDSSS